MRRRNERAARGARRLSREGVKGTTHLYHPSASLLQTENIVLKLRDDLAELRHNSQAQQEQLQQSLDSVMAGIDGLKQQAQSPPNLVFTPQSPPHPNSAYISDIFDTLKELGAIDRLRNSLQERRKRKLKLRHFTPEFLDHKPDETYLMDYYSWTQEAKEWYSGDGDVYAMSVREMKTWWSDPKLFAIYDAALTKFTLRGGQISRIMVIEHEFFDPAAQLLLLRTGYRHYLLGMEPLMIYRPDSWNVVKDLGVDCDLFGCANNRVAYFNRLDGEPLCVKSHSKKFIGKAHTTFRSLMKQAKPFEEWRSTVSWGNRLREIVDEEEQLAELIREFARGA